MNLKALRAELADPVYLLLDNAAVAASLNKVTKPAAASTDRIVKLMLRHGTYANIIIAARGDDALAKLCINTLRILDGDEFGAIDLNDSGAAQALSGLVQGGIMSQAQADELTALTANQQSRADELGLGRVTEHDVFKARAT